MYAPAMDELPIVCSLRASEFQQRREGLLAHLVALATERRLTEEGASLEFATSEPVTALLAQVLAAERQCCRFLRFRVTFEPDLGPILLEITGPSGTCEFLQGVLGLGLAAREQ